MAAEQTTGESSHLHATGSDFPHRRYNPLKDEWILVSPHRAKRPWKGQVEQRNEQKIPRHDPANPLCPGATRPNGTVNEDYESTFVFPNDFPAMYSLEKSEMDQIKTVHPLLRAEPVSGECHVMCYHKWTDVTIATMDRSQVKLIVDKWVELQSNLGKKHTWVQIFSNEGPIMGCSNPHPHCQIWASSFLPNEPALKDRMQLEYWKKNSTNLLLDYVKLELESMERVVLHNKHWVCVVPYWAVWPYETMLIAREHVLRLDDLTETQKQDLASIMQKLLIIYDNLFQCPFPYSMGWHGAPSGEMLSRDHQHWQLHALYYPPLLRSASVKKFMVGYEMLANAQRDFTAEQAAEKLRSLPTTHYSLKCK